MNNPLRRKKTLREARIGNQKPKIFSYSSGQNINPQGRANSNAQAYSKSRASSKSRISRTINYLIILLLGVGFVYMCLLKPDAQVKIVGDQVYPRDKTNYEQQIDRQLKSSIFYRFKPTFTSSKLSADIKSTFPEVDSVNIIISPFRHRPVIEVSLAKPTAKLVTNSHIYILDGEGRALFEQKDSSATLDTKSLLTINDDSGQNIALGQPALTQQQISYIREIIGQTTAKQIQPRSFTLSDGGTALNVRFKNLGYLVKFSFYADPRQSSGAFLALYDELKRNGTRPSDYIDLRIPDKAFVR